MIRLPKGKPLAIIILILLFLIGVAFLKKPKQYFGEKIIDIKNHPFKMEIADTPEKRALGLSGRREIKTDQGMIFIFPEANYYSFWMKDMKFPLDFIWIKGDEVVDLTADVDFPKSQTTSNQLPIYTSSFMVDKVIEVKAGTVKTLGLKIGDKIKI